MFPLSTRSMLIASKVLHIKFDHRPRHSSRGYSPASYRGCPGSNPGLVMWEFVMDKSGAGAGFLRELRFPLPIYIPSASPQSSSISPEARTIGQEWPQCQYPHTHTHKKTNKETKKKKVWPQRDFIDIDQTIFWDITMNIILFGNVLQFVCSFLDRFKATRLHIY
jgi:hypothetical protein